MSDEVVGLVVEGGVEAPVVGKPDEQTSNHPPAFDGKEPAVAGSTGRERDMNVMIEGGLGEQHPW
jgi:hypothetical protein